MKYNRPGFTGELVKVNLTVSMISLPVWVAQ